MVTPPDGYVERRPGLWVKDGPIRSGRHPHRGAWLAVIDRRFASTSEAERAEQLLLAERAGRIEHLRFQQTFHLHAPGGVPVGKYVADFTYVQDGREVVEDFKGAKETELFKWKARHMRAEHGIEILITRKPYARRR